MTNLKRKFELFRGPEWKVSRHKFGSQSTISGPLTRACARGGGWAWTPPLSLRFYETTFITCSKEI